MSSNFPSGQSCSPYSVEVDEVAVVLGPNEEGAVVASERLPGSMEVIGHDVDKVQLPDAGKGKGVNIYLKKLKYSFKGMLWKPENSLGNLSDLISSINGSLPCRHSSGQHELVVAGGSGLSCIGSHKFLEMHSRNQTIYQN